MDTTERPSPAIRYRKILADPPCDMHQKGKWGAICHYPLMILEAICSFRVDQLAAEDAHLWLWVINAALHAGHHVMQAWDFTYRSCLTWIKPRLGMGKYLRNQTEHLLLGNTR